MPNGVPVLFFDTYCRNMQDEALLHLGYRIRQIRLEKNMTQAELAERCSCNRNYISMLERGERNPSYKSLLMIAKGLGVQIQLLVMEYTQTS